MPASPVGRTGSTRWEGECWSSCRSNCGHSSIGQKLHVKALRGPRAAVLRGLGLSRSGFPELLHDREHVAQRAREPIQLPDNDDITGAKLIEEPEELGPLPTSTGSLLAKDAFAPSRFERGHLSSGVLIVRGNAGVTDQHCIKVSLITLVLQ